MGESFEKVEKRFTLTKVITMVEYLIMVIILMTQEIF